MEYIIDNWFVIVGIIALLVAAGFAIYKFAGLPTKEQIVKIKEMILYWVIIAEEKLGSGTGDVKLRFVYDLFTSKYPLVAKIISFERFSSWVDESLEKMELLLKEKAAIAELVAKEEVK